MSNTFPSGTALLLALIASGCGSTAVEEEKLEILFGVTTEAPGERCPFGGTAATVGFDADGDEVLSEDEVALTEYFCQDHCTPAGGLWVIESEDDWLDLVEGGCEVIFGNLRISVPNVKSLGSASGIIRVGGDLVFERNDELEDLVGFESLTEIGGSLAVRDNPSLSTLSGLDSLALVRGGVAIHHNDGLVDFEGLGTLSMVGGRFVVKNNRSLRSMFGLGPMGTVGGLLRIAENPVMESVSGLGFVASIGGELRIDRNPGLFGIAHLLALRSLGGDLVILDNTALPECEALSLRDRLLAGDWSQEARVEGNDTDASCN